MKKILIVAAIAAPLTLAACSSTGPIASSATPSSPPPAAQPQAAASSPQPASDTAICADVNTWEGTNPGLAATTFGSDSASTKIVNEASGGTSAVGTDVQNLSHDAGAGSGAGNDINSLVTDCATAGVTLYGRDFPAPGPQKLSMGQSVQVADSSTGATELTITTGNPVVSRTPANQYGSSPQNGYFLVVTITAKADPSYTSGATISSSDFYVLINGTHYSEDNGNAMDALSSSQSELPFTTLGAGESISGPIAFDIPSHGELVYAPNSDGQPLDEWSF